MVTIYSADGLHDGIRTGTADQFDAFTKATGIKVQYIEAGSGVVVDRIAKEKSNPQADVLVTLPPFIMQAAADGLLQPYKPSADMRSRRRQGSEGPLRRAGEQLSQLHLQRRRAEGAAEDLRGPARSQVQGQDPVFDARPGRRRHRA